MYLRQIIQQAKVVIIVSFLLTLWLLLSPNQVLAGGDNLYNIASFGCDVGHENVGTLYPNGQPICGTPNCPSTPARPPDGCWSKHFLMPVPPERKVGSEAGVSWDINDKGRLKLGVDRDNQMIAWTWVWVRAEKTIPLYYSFDSGGYFVNGYQVVDANNVKLVAGWNLLEFTAYHQHDGSSGGMPDDYDLVSKVDYMNSEPVEFELKAEPADLHFVIPLQGCSPPPAQQVVISEIHNANFVWTSTVLSPTWISFTPSGTTPSTATLTIKDAMCTLGVGSHEGTILVTTNLAGIKNDPLHITVTVEITEIQPPPDKPDICLPRTALDFGEVIIGQSKSLPLLINNCGKADLSIHNISSDNPAFIVPITSGTIPPGKGKTFDVIFAPQEKTLVSGQLAITSNDPDEQTVNVSLSGTGITIFEDVASQAGVDDPSASNGVIWGDYDNNGNQDIYIVNTGKNTLYRNRGDGTFENVTDYAGVGDEGQGADAAFGDYDNDGFLDIYVVNSRFMGVYDVESSGANVLYRNKGDGTFENVTDSVGVGDKMNDGRAGGFFDCDNDGKLDIFVVNYTGNNILFHNTGTGTFTAIPLDNGTNEMNVAFGDYDNDGFVDLYIVNDLQSNILYHNNGDCSFSDVAVSAGVAFSGPGRAACFGDYNNDSYLDLYIVNMGATNVMYRNEGNGMFTNVTAELGVGYSDGGQDATFLDYDNDGYLDLFLTYRYGGNVLYRNNEGKNYTNVTMPTGIAGTDGKSTAFGDYNNDGQLDIYVANSTAKNQLFRNRGTGNHWLQVDLTGAVTNRAGIGARVIARVGVITMMRDVDGGSGHGSQNSLLVHLGLGAAAKVDILDIYWPSCRTQTFINVHADQVFSITEPNLQADFSASVTRGPAPLTVKFFDCSSGCPVGWEWAFGDGETSTEQNPEHTYTRSGIYTVKLTITDRFGYTAEKSMPINVENMVSINDAYAPINGELIIPVNIGDATGVAYVTMRLNYDQKLMQCKNVTLGDIPEFTLTSDCSTPGLVVILLSYAAGLEDGSGALVKIIFDVKDTTCFQHTKLSFDLLELKDKLLNPIPVAKKESNLTLAKKGDVNGDCECTSGDAIITLRIAIELHDPTDYQRWAANANEDDEIDSGDAVWILRCAVSLPTAAPLLTSANVHPISVNIPNISAEADSIVEIPLLVEPSQWLAAGDFAIEYNPDILTVTDVRPGDGMEDFTSPPTPSLPACGEGEGGGVRGLFAVNLKQQGKMLVSMASDSAISGNSDTIFIATVKINKSAKIEATSDFIIARANIFNEYSQRIPTDVQHGKLTVIEPLPTETKLLPNYPNPFNPETWIPYQLVRATEVTIFLYNIRGQLIRTLNLGQKNAGLYLTKEKAAHWDGRNELGEKVSSGVYFYTIRAGEYKATRKMLLNK